MRAVAILFVVCSHVLWVFPEFEGAVIQLLRFFGVMGVEIFFVLSGFLIGRILFRIFTSKDFKKDHLGYFLIRRWFRTLPNYYIILLVNILIVLCLGQEFPDNLVLYFFFLPNAIDGMDIFFIESWSLPIEEFAYIIGPLLLFLVFLIKINFSRKKMFLWITLVIISFFIISKIYYSQQVDVATLEYWNVNLKAVVLYRIDAIYYGVLAAYISLVIPHLWKKYKSLCLFIGIFLFSTIHVVVAWKGIVIEDFPFFWNVVYLPLCSICIALSLPVFSLLNRAPSILLRSITFISIISYSMYLLHYSIVLQLMKYYLPLEGFSNLQKIGYSLSYLLITILLSYFLFRWYEKPMMDIRDLPIIRKKFTKNTL